jgi:hypothetical protein
LSAGTTAKRVWYLQGYGYRYQDRGGDDTVDCQD